MGLITRLENLSDTVAVKASRLSNDIITLQKQLAVAKSELGKPFDGAEELNELLLRQSAIDAQLEFGSENDDVFDDEDTEDMEM